MERVGSSPWRVWLMLSVLLPTWGECGPMYRCTLPDGQSYFGDQPCTAPSGREREHPPRPATSGPSAVPASVDVIASPAEVSAPTLTDVGAPAQTSLVRGDSEHADDQPIRHWLARAFYLVGGAVGLFALCWFIWRFDVYLGFGDAFYFNWFGAISDPPAVVKLSLGLAAAALLMSLGHWISPEAVDAVKK